MTIPAVADRMPEIPESQMTPEQKKAAAEFSAGRGYAVRGPFACMLRSPEVMLRAKAMGDYVRFKSTIPPKLNELAICVTARHWTQNYEWLAHRRIAEENGLNPAISPGDRRGPPSRQPRCRRTARLRFFDRAAPQQERLRRHLRADGETLRRAGRDRSGGGERLLHVQRHDDERRAHGDAGRLQGRSAAVSAVVQSAVRPATAKPHFRGNHAPTSHHLVDGGHSDVGFPGSVLSRRARAYFNEDQSRRR